MVSWASVILLLGHCLLALGVVLFCILSCTCLRRYLQRPEKAVPLPTPPTCRRHLSVKAVYPPTPPITREQLSFYTICRPTPPDSPLISVKPAGKTATPLSHFTVDMTATQPYLSHCYTPPATPPLKPHIANASINCTQPAGPLQLLQPGGLQQLVQSGGPHQLPRSQLTQTGVPQPLRPNWSVPGHLYRLLDS